MAFDPRIAQQIQNLLAARVPLADAYRIAGVSQADRVYYGLNATGTVIPTAVPPPAQIQVNNLQAEVTATQDRIAALRQVVDDPNATRTARAAAQVNITRQQTALTEYQRELANAQAQVAQQTVVPTAVRATPAAQPTPAPEPPVTSLIPPGYSGVLTNDEGVVIGYILRGGEIEWVPGFEPVEETEPAPQTDPYEVDGAPPAEEELVEVTEPAPQTEADPLADPTADIGPPTAQPEPQPDPFGGNGPAFDDDGNLQPGWDLVDGEPVFVGFEGLTYGPGAQDDPYGGGEEETPDYFTAADQEDADMGQAMREALQLQATSAQRAGQNTAYDWRVKITLAPQSNYLYNAESPGILGPLKASQGVVFPYTPTIQTNYVAQYDQTDLTHSNYRGYFYKNSRVEQVSVNGTFTAQNTTEAQYLLAVIHFFRSVTKMFYGQDKERGTPPPIVYLWGFGEYQFANHPCLVSSFNYSLPNGVDYIRTQASNQNLQLDRQRPTASGSTFGQLFAGTGLDSVTTRISTLTNLLTGNPIGRGANASNSGDLGLSIVNNTSLTTYVPTKMEIQVTLLPLQTRKQVSQEFSLKAFANGSLLKGRGFW